MVPSSQIQTLAQDLLRARASRTTIVPPTKGTDGFTLSDGYAVSSAIEAIRTQAGRRVVGQKIGLTNRAIWDRLDLEHPVWAPVYDDGIYLDGDVFVSHLVAAKLEIEVVLCFDRAVPPGADLEQIADSVLWAALGFEIVDCHYPDWALTPPDLVADFGCHAGLLIGASRPLTSGQLFSLSDLELTLRCDGEVIATGGSQDVLGGPLESVHAMLISPHARAIHTGDVVATGALTRGAHPVEAGTHWTAHASGGPSFESVGAWIK
ncbi:MAG TPA: hypothetical protein VNV87_01625 [Acidimicrobiales bacterium]|jgi:2-keto-4-pentenoate hydratase|nr:hypothetical protein [Acidimicrobiales bacterium]